MTIEAQIQALLSEAEPLRRLPDDEGERMGLARIIDAINGLRALQASGAEPPEPAAPVVAVVEGADAVAAVYTVPAGAEPSTVEAVKRKPGRPKKHDPV